MSRILKTIKPSQSWNFFRPASIPQLYFWDHLFRIHPWCNRYNLQVGNLDKWVTWIISLKQEHNDLLREIIKKMDNK